MAWHRTGEKPLFELMLTQVHWPIYAVLEGWGWINNMWAFGSANGLPTETGNKPLFNPNVVLFVDEHPRLPAAINYIQSWPAKHWFLIPVMKKHRCNYVCVFDRLYCMYALPRTAIERPQRFAGLAHLRTSPNQNFNVIFPWWTPNKAAANQLKLRLQCQGFS